MDNVIECAVLNLVDITEARRLQEARFALDQKYDTLNTMHPDAHLVTEISEDGRDLGFIDCNQAALDLLGMTRDQLLDADFVCLSPERQPGGEPLPVEVTMTVFHEQGKIFLHSVWRDLAGLRRTEPPMEHPAESNQEGKKQ